MGNITKPYGDFTNNVDVADANKVNAQINQLYTTVNGGLDFNNVPGLGDMNTVTTTAKTAAGAINELQALPVFSMYRQALINGNFDVWQRGTSFTGFVYNADRWLMRGDGSGETSTVSRQLFTLGQGVVPNEPKYFWRKQVTVAPTGQTFNQLAQRIESVRSFANSKVTVSFWAKADTARTIQSTFQQIFGTGGSPSSSVGVTGQSHSLTASWQKFTATFTIPSISGKTLGTNGDDYLELDFTFPINSLLTIDIAQVQVNAGDQALLVQPRSFGEELLLCQRYYEKSYDYATVPFSGFSAGKGYHGVNNGTSTSNRITTVAPFKTRKRITTPTVTTYDNLGASGKLSELDTTDSFVSGITPTYVTATDSNIFVSHTVTARSGIAFAWTSDAEL